VPILLNLILALVDIALILVLVKGESSLTTLDHV